MPKNQWMDKENVVYMLNRVWFIHEEEWNSFIYKEKDGTGGYLVGWGKPSSERQTSHVFTHMQNMYLKKQ
jgi:hypothetical protein